MLVAAAVASCLCKHWHSGWLCAAALKQTCRGGVSSGGHSVKPEGAECSASRDGSISSCSSPPPLPPSIDQSQGTKSGWLIEPDSFQFMTNTQAMARALETFAEIQSYTWPDGDCGYV